MKRYNKVLLNISALLLIMMVIGTNSATACKIEMPNEETPRNSQCIRGHFSWKTSAGQKYLQIYAFDYYSLGYLTGKGLMNQILSMDYIIKLLINFYGFNLQQILKYSQIYDLFIPQDYRDEMIGMSDATHLSYDEILLQVVFLDLYYGILIPSQIGLDEVGACTALVVKNSRRHISIGQNMDFGQMFFPTLAFVKHSVLGKMTTFSLRMGASTLAIGKNRKVSSTQTLVQTWKMAEFGTPTGIKARFAFENKRNALEFYETMTSSYCASWNYIISDFRGNVIAAETIPGLSICHTLEEGEMRVKSNTFISSELLPYLINPLYSIVRQEKAEDLVSEYMSNWVKPTDLMEVLSYNDGTEASICRFPDPVDPTQVCTEAFFVSSGIRRGYFGIGNPVHNSWGLIPL